MEQFNFEGYDIDNLDIRQDDQYIYQVIARIQKAEKEVEETEEEPTYLGAIILEPKYPWPVVEYSRLIESILYRVPVPPIYLTEHLDGNYRVMDGTKRLHAIRLFIENKIFLDGVAPALQGKLFQELPNYLQRRFEDTRLTIYRVDYRTPENIRMVIYNRLNNITQERNK